MQKEIIISEASWKDFSQVMELERVCFPQDVWPMFDVLGVLSFPWFVRIKAEVDLKLVGFIAGEVKKAKMEGWISTIGTLPEYQRNGIGKKLLLDCEKKLNVPIIKLSVRKSNLRAIEFYRGLGYEFAGTWKKYYKGDEDGIVMQKEIR